MRTDGSGRDRASKLDQQHKEILAIGVTQADTIKHNPTTEKLHKETTNRVFQFSTTFTMMDLNGMMLLVIILNLSSARIPMSC
jgi:hypothetical protein